MKNKTQPQLAKEYGLTLDVIKKLKQDGVDIQDEKAVREAKSKQRHRVKGESQLPNHDISEGSEDVSLAEMKQQLSIKGVTIDEIKALKEAGLAHKALTAAQKEEGLVISILAVEERETKIGAAVKSAFDKLGNELPGKCAGLDEVGVMNIYNDLKREILIDLADITSEFWRERK